MIEHHINRDIMEYMVWVVEIVAAEFFGRDKSAAYTALKENGLWDIYIDHYDTTHTLSQEYLLEEIRDYLLERGVGIL